MPPLGVAAGIVAGGVPSSPDHPKTKPVLPGGDDLPVTACLCRVAVAL